jgi:hypothetical protein
MVLRSSFTEFAVRSDRKNTERRTSNEELALERRTQRKTKNPDEGRRTKTEERSKMKRLTDYSSCAG